jgi:hypothetical protein
LKADIGLEVVRVEDWGGVLDMPSVVLAVSVVVVAVVKIGVVVMAIVKRGSTHSTASVTDRGVKVEREKQYIRSCCVD